MYSHHPAFDVARAEHDVQVRRAQLHGYVYAELKRSRRRRSRAHEPHPPV